MVSSNQNNVVEDDFLIFRCRQGIRLVNPKEAKKYGGGLGYNTGHSVDSMLDLPMFIYFLDADSKLKKCSALHEEAYGDSIGKNVHDVFQDKNNRKLMDNDGIVMRNNRFQFFDEHLFVNGEIQSSGLTIKFPWYDDRQNVQGIFGCTIDLKTLSPAHSLMTIHKTGLLNNLQNFGAFIISGRMNDVHITKRENQVLTWLVKGGSARSIADRLQISTRTVETYINHMKQKVGVKTKQELIEKFL